MKRPLIDFETFREPNHPDPSTPLVVAGHRGATIVNISVLPVAVALDPSASLPIAELVSSGIMTGFRDTVSLLSCCSWLTIEWSTRTRFG